MTPEEKVEKYVNQCWPDRLAYMTLYSNDGSVQTYEVRLDHVEKWRADIHFVHLHEDGTFTVDAEER